MIRLVLSGCKGLSIYKINILGIFLTCLSFFILVNFQSSIRIIPVSGEWFFICSQRPFNNIRPTCLFARTCPIMTKVLFLNPTKKCCPGFGCISNRGMIPMISFHIAEGFWFPDQNTILKMLSLRPLSLPKQHVLRYLWTKRAIAFLMHNMRFLSCLSAVLPVNKMIASKSILYFVLQTLWLLPFQEPVSYPQLLQQIAELMDMRGIVLLHMVYRGVFKQ